MKKSFKKQRLETSIHPQIHKISRITDIYDKTKYLGMTLTNNEVSLEQCWIREIFEFSKPDFYKQVTTARCDDTRHKTYTVPVGRCSLNNSQEKNNYLDMNSNALKCLTDSYGKTKYLGRKFTNNEVALEQCWIREIFVFSEPDFYKQVTTVRCD